MSQAQRAPHPQAVPEPMQDERDDGPDAVGIVFWLGFAAMLVFGAGVYVGFTQNVDAWYVALRGMGL